MTRQTKTTYTVFFALVALCACLVAGALVDSSLLRTISSFSTDLAPRSPEQRHNIIRAASRIDGITIKPGQEFSFNDTVGLCGVAQGYERAPTIIDREIRPAWGGGVCQVSSTLYNAALLANLKITRRHAHSRTVRSVPPGRDATTAFGIADLCFVNTTSSPIRISARASETRLVMSILGQARSDVTAEIITETVAETASARLSRSGPRPMFELANCRRTVLTYRIVKRGGVEVERELISNDTYEVRR